MSNYTSIAESVFVGLGYSIGMILVDYLLVKLLSVKRMIFMFLFVTVGYYILSNSVRNYSELDL